jgi:hypothetical protein
VKKKRKRRKYTGPIYHNHHIVYEGEGERPEWIVSIRSWMHKAVTLLSQLKATPEHYAEAINFQTAINDLVNRMRMRLDTEGDE